ncbi:MAG TPA: SGNH/GDSL hydrolase family protein [Planctomycetota bacterium]|nr:SGNH/GDSL hydrolase family protein [Planctomycetota bacterium]
MQRISPDDPRLSWHGCVSLEKTRAGVKPWRIFHQDRALYYPVLMERTQKTSGVRIAFYSTTTALKATIAPWPEMCNVDICCDGELLRTVELAINQTHWSVTGLPAKRKLIEIWLPPKAHTTLKSLEIDTGAGVVRYVDKRPRWATYGSSITQCSISQSPVHTWPAIVARNCGFNLLNLGFSGECCLDAMVARVMRDSAVDFLSMEIGPNIYGSNALNERSFRASILAFVAIVREGHPQTPYVLMTPIHYPVGETRKNTAGFTMQEMRQELAAAAQILRANGDKHLHFVDGTTVMGPEHLALMPDGCHPTPEGYKVMGENFTHRVARKYFKRRRQ